MAEKGESSKSDQGADGEAEDSSDSENESSAADDEDDRGPMKDNKKYSRLVAEHLAAMARAVKMVVLTFKSLAMTLRNLKAEMTTKAGVMMKVGDETVEPVPEGFCTEPISSETTNLAAPTQSVREIKL